MPKHKEKINNTNGITLVTLVITIVVLLILSGVTISTITGDNGLIAKTKSTTEESREKIAKEEVKKIVSEYDLTDKKQSLEEFLNTKVPDKIDEVINNGDGTITVSKDGYTITINNEGKKDETTDDNKKDDETKQEPTLTVGTAKVVANSDGTGDSLGEASTYLGNTLYINFTHAITGGTTTVSPSLPYAVTANGTYSFTVTGTVDGKTYTKDVTVIVNQFKDVFSLSELKIGDYVNYTYDDASSYSLSSSYSGYSSNQTIAQTKNLKWQVLNVDKENDTVDIISEKPTSSYVYFGGILGYNNGAYLMNDICKAQYSNKTLVTEARSINLLDMEKHLTEPGITTRNNYQYSKLTAKYGTTKTYTTDSTYGNVNYYPKLYANQKGAGINTTNVEKTTITGENAKPDPYNESETGTGLTKDSVPGQATSRGLTATQTEYNIAINSNNYGTASNVLRSSTTFWVAARSVAASSYRVFFRLRKASSYMETIR